MAEKTAIAWCDSTWNPVEGCTSASPGCAHCYARARAQRLKLDFTPRPMPSRLDVPLHWRKGRRVFVPSLGDMFHEAIPFEYIATVFGAMAAAPQHTFIVCTKRPQRMAAFFEWMAAWHDEDRDGAHDGPIAAMWEAISTHPGPLPGLDNEGDEGDALGVALDVAWPLPNVWLLTTAEDQDRANERVPWLLRCPAVVRGVNVEPQLEPVSFGVIPWGPSNRGYINALTGETEHAAVRDKPYAAPSPGRLSWVICGGESGRRARPFDLTWMRRLRDQCKVTGVPFFAKQLGAHAIGDEGDCPSGRREAGRLLLEDSHGADEREWPADLRGCRAWPQVQP